LYLLGVPFGLILPLSFEILVPRVKNITVKKANQLKQE